MGTAEGYAQNKSETLLYAIPPTENECDPHPEEIYRQQLIKSGRWTQIEKEMKREAADLAAKPWIARTFIKLHRWWDNVANF